MIGTELGPYKIIEQLGAGGMGEVWLAEDTRLARKVAIKVLPAEFAADPERLARFEQEARAAAALNHPHIAAVFDVGSADAAGAVTHFMVQEHLEGDTIGAALDGGRLPLKTALLYAAEIAEALTAAHDAGIVHRDLKPANVFVTKDGHAKVLDFGLAKLTEITAGTTSGSGETVTAMAAPSQRSPSMLGTVAGQVMGTAGYMAPEQVEGAADVDARADVFAFGCLLYEMTTGKQAFTGRSTVETLQRIAHEEPEQSIGDIDPSMPADLERIVRKCLVKERDGRYQHAADLLVDVRSLRAEVEAGTATPIATPATESVAAPTASVTWSAAAAGVVVTAILAAAAGWYFAGSAPADRAPVTELVLEADFTVAEIGRGIAISPDGRTVVFSTAANARLGTGPQLFVRDLGRFGAVPLDGTSNGLNPFFSPSGEWVGFYVTGEQKLKKVPINGGQPFELTDGAFVHGAWGGDDTIVFGAIGAGVQAMPAGGGEPRAVLSDPTEAQIVTDVLPDGGAALIDLAGGSGAGLVDLDSGEVTPLFEDGLGARYAASGHLVYSRGNEIWAVRFDPQSRQITGQPVPVVQRVRPGGFDIADDGTLVYIPGTQSSLLQSTERLVWVGSEGQAEPTASPIRDLLAPPSISPDGRRATLQVRSGEEFTETAIYVFDLERGTDVRLSDSGLHTPPVWGSTPDWIVYGGELDERFAIFRRQVAFPDREPEVLVELDSIPNVTSVSRTGDALLYDIVGPDLNGRDVYLLPLGDGTDGAAVPEPLLASDLDEAHAGFSPDGRYVVFSSRTGLASPGSRARGTTRGVLRQIFVRDRESGETYPVSPGQGNLPRWSPDGSRILYIRQNVVVSAEVTLDPGFEVGVVEDRFQIPAGAFFEFDVAADGRLLMVAPDALATTDDEVAALRGIHVIQNFFERLRAALPDEG